jgi:hypothetical protein
MASKTQTFHHITVWASLASYQRQKHHAFCHVLPNKKLASVHLEALYMHFIVPNLTMYMQPYERLARAQMRDKSDVVRVNGSPAAIGIWNMVRIALDVLIVYSKIEPL